jgi:serine/threonine protein kinase
VLLLACRDLKPSNLLMDEKDNVVIADLGCCYVFTVSTGLPFIADANADPGADAVADAEGEPTSSSAAGAAGSSVPSSKQLAVKADAGFNPNSISAAGADGSSVPSSKQLAVNADAGFNRNSISAAGAAGSSVPSSKQLAVSAHAGFNPNSSSAAGAAGSSVPSSKQRYGPAMKDFVGTENYQALKIGNLVASNVYDASVDCYSSVVVAMSLVCGGWEALCAAAEPWPAGVSRQKRSLKNWLRRIADGEDLAVSAELRDFVEHGISPFCTAEQLLAHPWLSGAKLPG